MTGFSASELRPAFAPAAFLDAFLGSRLVRKVTIRTLQVTVAVLLLLIAILLGSGII